MSQEWRITSPRQTGGFDDPFWQDSYPKLRQYCRYLTRNEWDGDDITQETYLKAMKYTNKQQKLTSALVNKIAYHHWVDQLRKRSKETLESEKVQYSVTKITDAKEDSVELLINTFTPKQAIIFFLKEAFHYQNKEIAKILGTTEMAVKANLHRAKKRIEKSSEGEKSCAVENFWDAKEQEVLSDLFMESLENQDPSVLIENLTSLTCVNDAASRMATKYSPIQNATPSSTLCMAA